MCVQLEYVPTQALVEEIFKRTTFAGVMIYSPDHHKRQGQHHPDFTLLSTCEDRSTIGLLEKALEEMRERAKEG